ncbi:hypothetical protein B279_00735 [Streptococcus equinus ATCC 33317]|uniref:hypothetical protein n=1 Tax=Streptococcus equinus TaxID=1335 RepID=UPI0005022ADD|nr:hypothetical protein [Streptococcus equinus]KFN87553.1 hypothetical protein B279_00735 [Streptococcus equinus ATCC 33317]SDQ60331.1 hypothetical protein SAMN04488495_1644 [Streptococcus equinus]SEN92186.1 hypothetical protein SAMN04488496_1782 [Streptococcus equinus]
MKKYGRFSFLLTFSIMLLLLSGNTVLAKSKKSKMITNTANYSQDSVKAIDKAFGKWLYNSSYGKDNTVVQGEVYDIYYNTCYREGDVGIFRANTEDGLLFGRFSGFPQDGGSLSELVYGTDNFNPSLYFGFMPDMSLRYVIGDEVDAPTFLSDKNSFKLAPLGVDLSSDNLSDYDSQSSFRVYQLNSGDRKNITFDQERQMVDDTIPLEEYTKPNFMGYSSYYESFVNQDKPSYEIILANNGKVYWVKDYFLKNYSFDEEYKLAPKAMQKQYQKLLKKYKKSSKKKTSTSKTPESSKDAEETSIIPKEMVGTWEADVNNQGHQEITYQSNGSATLDTENGENSGMIRSMENVSGNIYRFVDYDFEAAFPMFGIGGAGFRTELGVKLGDNTITFVQWTGELDTEFDPSTYRYEELGTFYKVQS